MEKILVIHPSVDEFLRNASRDELRSIKNYIDQLIEDIGVLETLASHGLEKGDPSILDFEIERVNFTSRLYNILRSAKLWTLRDIKEYGKSNLLLIRGLGKAGFDELEKEFARRGLSLLQ